MKKPKLGKAEQTANVSGIDYDWVGSCLASSLPNNRIKSWSLKKKNKIKSWSLQ